MRASDPRCAQAGGDFRSCRGPPVLATDDEIDYCDPKTPPPDDPSQYSLYDWIFNDGVFVVSGVGPLGNVPGVAEVDLTVKGLLNVTTSDCMYSSPSTFQDTYYNFPFDIYSLQDVQWTMVSNTLPASITRVLFTTSGQIILADAGGQGQYS